ncbi:helix-turn-helix transcriptional regulator [Pseudooceanicola sp. 216_PA32_1]|uniref:Helix-turn-helix transcriptional regulator n=2 Tax=Pseudooceanicola pacificus TaxID=2676438 RepID=A0A844W8N2_9RHOB|nr:helix-turn-helix transcriptional regulator [Pseudooceanicola pacificus]
MKGMHQSEQPDQAAFEELIEIERILLRRLALGDQSQQMADRLGMPDRTLAWHLKNMRRKLKARTNAHAVSIAVSNGLI